MAEITLRVPWGEAAKEFRLPEESVAWTISPKAIPPVPDEKAEILQEQIELEYEETPHIGFVNRRRQRLCLDYSRHSAPR